MSAPQLPPPEDNPGRSPQLLQPLPKRGAGVRRLNRVPVFVFIAGVCLVVGAIGYTYRSRLQSSAAALHGADTKAEAASGPAVLNGAPQTGEIQSAAFRSTAAPPLTQPPPAQPTQAQRGPTDGGQQQAQEDDPAVQARKQAWQTYYQQLAALQQSRQQDTTNALKADTAPNGITAGGGASAPPGVSNRLEPRPPFRTQSRPL